MQTASDVALLVVSDNARSEQRVSPAWSIERLRNKLEPITGVPVSCQSLTLHRGSGQTSLDVDVTTQLNSFALRAGDQVHVRDTRPPGARENYTDVSAVAKYEMPREDYESRSDSVLAWKRANKLGRFDPEAPNVLEKQIVELEREVVDAGIKLDCRVKLLPLEDSRRGTVKYIGLIPELPGHGPWVGVCLDEPTGKNDGTVNGTRYFSCPSKCGVVLRAHRLQVGDFPTLDLGEDDEF